MVLLFLKFVVFILGDWIYSKVFPLDAITCQLTASDINMKTKTQAGELVFMFSSAAAEMNSTSVPNKKAKHLGEPNAA